MKEKNMTKDKIIEAMYELVAKEGYEKASTGKIAEMIGIKKASIYYHFTSKEEIFLEVIKKANEATVLVNYEEIEAVDNSRDLYELAVLLGKEYINFYEENTDNRKILLEVENQISRMKSVQILMDDFEIELKKIIETIIKKAVTLNIINSSDYTAYVNYIEVVTRGIDHKLLLNKDFDAYAVWNIMLKQIFGGLYGN